MLITLVISRLGIPKRKEDFLFFTIQDAAAFKKDLKELIPAITTTAQIQKFRSDISNHKRGGKQGLLKCVGIGIAFSAHGLSKVNSLWFLQVESSLIVDFMTVARHYR